MKYKSTITFIIFFIAGISCFSQDKKFLSPNLTISADYIPEQEFVDFKEKYSTARANAIFNYPVLSRRFALTNSLEYKTMVILANAHAGYGLPTFSFLDEQHQLLNGNAGMSFIYSSGSKNTLVANATVGVAEDLETIQSFQLRFGGLFILKHKFNGDFSGLIGAHYSYVYGRGLPLPVLGAIIRAGDKAKFKIILPVNISYMRKLNEWDMLTIFVAPEGGQNNICNCGDTVFAGRPDVVRFRSRAFKAGVNYKIGVNDRIHLTPEIGFLTRRNIAFSDAGFTAKESFIKEDVKGMVYAKVSMRILFGDLKFKRTGDNFLLNDERLDDYDLDEITKL